MRTTWRFITRNEDGTPLFGLWWFAPVAIVVTIIKVVTDCFF